MTSEVQLSLAVGCHEPVWFQVVLAVLFHPGVPRSEVKNLCRQYGGQPGPVEICETSLNGAADVQVCHPVMLKLSKTKPAS